MFDEGPSQLGSGARSRWLRLALTAVLALVSTTSESAANKRAPSAASKSSKKSHAPSWLGVMLSGRVALISDVIPNTPAQKAGLRPGDIVVRVDGQVIGTATDLIAAVSNRKPGAKVQIVVERFHAKKTIPVVLEAKPGPSEMLRRRFLDQPASEFALRQVGGSSVSLSDLRGEVVVVEHFATWCRVCRSTFQTLSELSDRGAVVLALSGESLDKLRAFIKEEKPPFVVLSDIGSRVQSRYDARAVPVHMVIDREGIIRHIGVGGSAAELDRLLDATARALRAKVTSARNP